MHLCDDLEFSHRRAAEIQASALLPVGSCEASWTFPRNRSEIFTLDTRVQGLRKRWGFVAVLGENGMFPDSLRMIACQSVTDKESVSLSNDETWTYCRPQPRYGLVIAPSRQKDREIHSNRVFDSKSPTCFRIVLSLTLETKNGISRKRLGGLKGFYQNNRVAKLWGSLWNIGKRGNLLFRLAPSHSFLYRC